MFIYIYNKKLLWPNWLRRRAYNAEIVGSSPTRSKEPLAEWSNATDLRSVSFGSAGSNPARDISSDSLIVKILHLIFVAVIWVKIPFRI